MARQLPADFDCFIQARRVVEGCKHMLGCGCDPPFWLREPTEAESKHYYQQRSDDDD